MKCKNCSSCIKNRTIIEEGIFFLCKVCLKVWKTERGILVEVVNPEIKDKVFAKNNLDYID